MKDLHDTLTVPLGVHLLADKDGIRVELEAPSEDCLLCFIDYGWADFVHNLPEGAFTNLLAAVKLRERECKSALRSRPRRREGVQSKS